MQRSSHFISSFNNTIELDVTGSVAFHKALKNETFWYEFIPGFQNKKNAIPSLVMHVIEDDQLDYTKASQTIRTSIQTIKRVIVLAEASFEYLRQQKSLYTLHGSVIVRDGKAVALIGNLSGMGKTTLAAYASKHDWTWGIDEKFTLYNGDVIGGTIGILNDTKTSIAAGQTAPTPLTQKYRLTLVCQPIITTESKATRFDLTPEKATWVFYDEMTRDIRQVDGIIDSSLPVLQSYDTETIARARHEATNSLVATVPVIYLRGTAEQLLDEIETMVL